MNTGSDGEAGGTIGGIETILDAAEAVILDLGVDKVTIDDIARAADISRATLYRRVGGREAIIGTILRRHAAPFVAETEAAVASEKSFPARIKAGMIHAIEALPRYPLLARTFGGGLSPYNLRIVRPVYQELVDASFQALFENARAAKVIPATLELAELSEWQMRNFLYLAADGPRGRDALERYIDQFILPVLMFPADNEGLARQTVLPDQPGPLPEELAALNTALDRAGAEIRALAALVASLRERAGS
ncbi:hypothetical protein A7Q26_18490 [Sphingobium sp. TCM1]|nr:hypothetical protein A7Q26_18490 [Sphingobium sp. TCM1]